MASLFTDQFGQNISDARKSLGLTQVEVANLLNCDQSDVSKVEKGTYIGLKMLKYLILLKDRGVDLNKIFHLKFTEEEVE